MDLLDTTQQAFGLLFTGDRELWAIIFVSLKVSVLAMMLAAPPAIAIAYWLATATFRGRTLLILLNQGLLAAPTVVVGLMLYLLLSRQGIFGSLHLLFTRRAMVLGQVLIALPVLVAFALAAVQGADARVRETTLTLGATGLRTAWTTLTEVRFGVMAAVFSAFGRVISEIGCSLMVGGNIAGLTRNIPTAIALETSKGEFAEGIALGLMLLTVALIVTFSLAFLQGDSATR